MDAPIALALMAKAMRVFGHDNTFPSFPITGQIAYEPDDLGFLSGDVSTNLDQQQVGLSLEHSVI